MTERKYFSASIGPRIEGLLRPVLQNGGFHLNYEIQDAEPAADDFETPDVVVKFVGADVDQLLANRAELLLALEHVTMEMLRVPSEDHSRISFDANDYRLLRVEELRMSALAAAEKVKRTRVPFHFNPMTSRERRVIHIALRDEKDLRSESVGVGPARAVVIVPADMPTPPAPPMPYGGPRHGSRGEGYRSGNGQRRGNGPREGHNRGGNRPRGGRGRGPR